MKQLTLPGIFLLFAIFILVAGCSEPPLKEPAVSISTVELSDLTLQTMTVNTSVIISNPNPVGAKLNKVAFDLYYDDGAEHYLGHGEKSGIEVKESGNTTVIIPVKIGNIQAVQAVGSLVRKGAITIRVNGSAFIDLKLVSYELPFERSRVFRAEEFTNLLPEVSLAGTSVNIPEGLEQAKGILTLLSG